MPSLLLFPSCLLRASKRPAEGLLSWIPKAKMPGKSLHLRNSRHKYQPALPSPVKGNPVRVRKGNGQDMTSYERRLGLFVLQPDETDSDYTKSKSDTLRPGRRQLSQQAESGTGPISHAAHHRWREGGPAKSKEGKLRDT